MPETPSSGLWIVAPSTIVVGEEFSLRVKALTEPRPAPVACYRSYPRLASPFNVSPRGIRYLDNAASRWEGTFEVEADSSVRGPSAIACSQLAGTFPADERAIGEIGGFHCTEPGACTIALRDPNTGVRGESNPIDVVSKPPERRLWWGDLHSQTFFSDGLRVPEELYHFARHEGFLDIFALADHAEWLTDRQWEYFTAVTNDADSPGRFATLVGLEWTNSAIGHRNLYYPGDHGPIIRSRGGGKEELERLFELARQHGGLLIPHHSANVTMGVKWEVGHEPEHERLVEIHSVWGNSERPASAGNPYPIRTLKGEQDRQHVLDALALGYRFGFVGGGDIHDGRPGDEFHNLQQMPEAYGLLSRQGIMGVYARELTREAVFEALWSRRCFATTNIRPLLEFEVCGAPMGSTVRTQGARTIRVRAVSEVPWARVEIVKNEQDMLARDDVGCRCDWEAEDAAASSADYYYVRLTREDGQMAWSSPVWVEPQ